MPATAVTSFLTLAELYPYYQQAVKTFYNTNLPIIYQKTGAQLPTSYKTAEKPSQVAIAPVQG